MQPHYSLLHRSDVEGPVGEVARRGGLEVFTFFSLASGLLTGKYRSKDDIAGTARENFLTGYSSDEAFRVVDALVEIAAARDAAPTSVALAWLIGKGVVPIASARTTEQLAALVAAPEVRLTADDVATLDRVSAPFA